MCLQAHISSSSVFLLGPGALHERRHQGALGISLYITLELDSAVAKGRGMVKEAYHRPNVRVRYRIKLLVPQLIIRSDIDVSAPILS